MNCLNSQRLREIEALAGTANERDALALEQAVRELLPLARVGVAAVRYVEARADYDAATAPPYDMEALTKLYERITSWHSALIGEGAEYVRARSSATG